MNNVLLVVISGILILIGTLGAVLPFLPGLPVAYVGLLLFAWFSKSVSIWTLVTFGILTLFTIVVDVLAPAIAARGHKASKMGITGAFIGGLVGAIFLPPLGILIGPFLGAYIGEMMTHANSEHALRVALASLFGLVIGSIFKLIVGASMFIYLVIASLRYLSS
ncbi:MAG: DUF456 domain-containing protein [Candidatus Doudnabacteria bacterium]|nr:DUF456 domain-containing protein [Candidatus Doudnabacteria bacterium]